MTVVIVGAQRWMGEAVGAALDHASMHVMGVATAAEGALKEALRWSPDVLLLDLDLGDAAADIAARVLERCPGLPVLAFGSDRAGDARMAEQIGARAYVSKHLEVHELRAAILAVSNGAATPRRRRTDAVRHAALTTRELEVLEHLSRGANGRQVARELSISEQTVRTHVSNILAKLQVSSRIEAVAVALRRGLLRPTGSGSR